jgi:hypothetical protein
MEDDVEFANEMNKRDKRKTSVASNEDGDGWEETTSKKKKKEKKLSVSVQPGSSLKLSALQGLLLWGLDLSKNDPRTQGIVLGNRKSLQRIKVIVVEVLAHSAY